MNILITGSTGLVGSEAVKFFGEKGWNVYGIDANMRAYFFHTPDKTPQIRIDIRNRVDVEDLFESVKFDAIVHAAAQPSHDWAKNEPLTDFDINARGTLILLEATRKFCPNATFVYVSTDKVYGENMKIELEEKKTRYSPLWEIATEIKPGGKYKPYIFKGFKEDLELDQTLRSLFGCSKLSADLYVQEYGRYFGMKTACFRPGCITGRQHEGAEYHGFLAYLVKCIKEGISYHIFGYKGKQVRDQIHAYDLVSAFYEFILNPKIAAVYNIGGGIDRSVSILEAIKLIEKETGKKAITEYVDKVRPGDRQWDIHDVSKFKADYPDWDYKYSLTDIIHELSN